MKTLALEVFSREGTGKGKARKLRREGFVPGVLYGQESALSLSIRMKDLQQILKAAAGSHSLLELTVEGKKKTALLKDLQFHPIHQVPIHADMFEVSMDQMLKIMIEVRRVGEDPVGFKTGGILTHNLTEVEVECLPLEIPPFLAADLSSLDVGDSFHVSDLEDLKVKVLTSKEQVLFTLVAPTIEVVEEPAEAEEGAEEAAAPGEEGEGKPSTPDGASES